jgi:septum formation protein
VGGQQAEIGLSTVSTVFVLASASPARRSVLRAAGVRPQVVVSEVDEDALVAGLSDPDPDEVVVTLAAAKAADVAARVAGTLPDAVVVGCDSMLLVDGELVGKPGTAEVARSRWRRMAGRTGELLTGHAVVRLVDGESHREAEGVASTIIRFGRPDDAELDAYLATGEPLSVAGAFTLDGRGGWFVEGVDGDPSSVIGISLPLTRRLLADVGVRVVDLWCPGQCAETSNSPT